MTVFFLCGLWHGASFNFVVWGLFHGAFLVLERGGLGAWLERRPAIVGHGYTLLAVMVGWVFFRAESFSAAVHYLGALAGLSDADPLLYPALLWLDGVVMTALLAGVIGSVPWLPRWSDAAARLREQGRTGAWLASRVAGLLGLGVAFFLCALVLAAGSYNPFIYFRF